MRPKPPPWKWALAAFVVVAGIVVLAIGLHTTQQTGSCPTYANSSAFENREGFVAGCDYGQLPTPDYQPAYDPSYGPVGMTSAGKVLAWGGGVASATGVIGLVVLWDAELKARGSAASKRR